MKRELDTLDIVVMAIAIAIFAFGVGLIVGAIISNITLSSEARLVGKGLPEPASGFLTFRELQQALVDRGHNIKVDGIIGRNTLSAWEKEICDDSALQFFTLTGAPAKEE